MYLVTYTYVILFLSGKKLTELDEFLESSSVVCGLSRPPISTTPSGEDQLECSNLGCSSLWEIDQEPFYTVVVQCPSIFIWIQIWVCLCAFVKDECGPYSSFSRLWTAPYCKSHSSLVGILHRPQVQTACVQIFRWEDQGECT